MDRATLPLNLLSAHSISLINDHEDEHNDYAQSLGEDGLMRQNTITSLRVTDLDELLKHISEGISSRKCGLSSLHDQSSRSHAFLEFELVSTVCSHPVHIHFLCVPHL